ncbi:MULTISPECIES: fumarylacetoacetate hydrolase family protein [unclassified Streptomyces]|uniref:fumarylacetoacetate hydrolase family protein n=1 Tax=unclassified Streptomyces TaxID=2593676 RepID=UPI002E75BECE|nr:MULTISPECIES: fumarylacetoacetate hydrolase family protein [unclassified Streptomyces]MEE1762863.1 fumarylacetoacetate hydrolase family protein [Streptomyces sp. SP18BB07]MEE1832993.1 fumarylacetoacetate hydrolase family protein [Streptomyces sp. SP17KL33]
MKLATIRLAGRTAAVRVEGDSLIDLGLPDVGAVLASPGGLDAAARTEGTVLSAADAVFAPLVPRPGKVVCVGLNYRNHIKEMGRDLPEYPTLFSKFADTLVGARDDIHRPVETEQFDWEAELTVVVGRQVRRADEAEAAAAIAGFTVLNDITCRDWQFRTREWLQGKNWDSTTPLGPYLVTPDEVGGPRPALDIRCEVNGQLVQQDNTGDLLFDPVDLVRYVSTMIRLNPGDIIATGTPGGVGHARKPQVYLREGDTVVTEIDGLGRLENRVITEGAA